MIKSLFDGEYPSAILFDLDGTLIDSVPDLHNALSQTLVAQGFSKLELGAARKWVGNGAQKLVLRGLSHSLSCAEFEVDKNLLQASLDLFFDIYERESSRHTQLYPSVIETLERLSAKNIAMACVTNKPQRFTQSLLDHFDLSKYLKVSVSGDTLVVKKPDPQPLFFALEQLGFSGKVSSTLMVGDSVNDVQAARNAGMPIACVSYGYNHGADIADECPDLLVDSFAELIE